MTSLQDRDSVMIIDDTPDNLRVLRQMLMEAGYKVIPAINGGVALKALKRQVPELILLDILMPGMDGFEVCNRLKSDDMTRDIPVIFISALHQLDDKIKAFSQGGVDYITKPFQIEEVLARVATHITLRKTQKRLEDNNAKLQQALNEIKTLKGLTPICASCKNVRDDQGFWKQVEVYISQRSEAEFSHAICPDCARKLYPEIFK